DAPGVVPQRRQFISSDEFSHIPTKQKRRSPGRGAKEPLDHQRPEKKMAPAWPLRPRAFAPQASVMASGVREDVATSIPVSCDGVKANAFLDDSTGFLRKCPSRLFSCGGGCRTP